MPITITPTAIPDVLVIEPRVFGDDRGWFFESFNEKDFSASIGRDITFVQDNHSLSKKGVLRGLHYQIGQTQGKLVRVVNGTVFDVAVDLRKSSSTFGRYVGVELSADNKKQIWIPEGFAHGFLSLSDEVELLYKVTEYWNPAREKTIQWNDPDVGIQWPSIDVKPILSNKDEQGCAWRNAIKFK